MTIQPAVFVVDDDGELCDALSSSLRALNFEVECYNSATEFLTMISEDRPGCLVLDLKMPDVDGLQVQQQLLQRGIRIPVIFVSGNGNVGDVAAAFRHGAFDFLEKPFELETLAARVRKALETDRKQRLADAELRTVRRRFDSLTEREREVMALLVAGAATATSRQIGGQLGISFRTVETYRMRLTAKMRARSISDLVHMARLCGIYRPTDR